MPLFIDEVQRFKTAEPLKENSLLFTTKSQGVLGFHWH